VKSGKSDFLGYAAFLIAASIIVLAILCGARSSQSAYSPNADEQSNDERNKILQDSLKQFAQELEHSGSSRDRFVAAHLLVLTNADVVSGQTPPPAEVVALAKNALRDSPLDADLAWIESTDCNLLKDACNSENAAQRMMQLQPDNVLAYLPALNKAIAEKDETGRMALMKKMSETKNSDMHYFATTNLFLDSLQKWQAPIVYTANELYGTHLTDNAPVTQDEAKLMQALQYSSAMAIPALQPLLEQCKPADMSVVQRGYCQKIAQAMMSDKTALIRHIALKIGLRTFNQQPEASEWQTLFRQSKWQNSPENRNTNPEVNRTAFMKSMSVQDENKLLEQQLLQNGIALDPPENWQPDDEEYRQIISATDKAASIGKQ